MKAILDFFLDWKIKLCIITALLLSLYFWHVSEVKIAINKAEMHLVQRYNKEINALETKAEQSTKILQAVIETNNKEKQIELEKSNRKYNDLQQWVRNLPSTTRSSDHPGDSSDPEASSREIIAELRRADAIAFADYSFRAEEVRLSLVQCYKDYDSVKDTLDAFRADNQPKE